MTAPDTPAKTAGPLSSATPRRYRIAVRRILIGVGLAWIAVLLGVGGVTLHWLLRPNTAIVDPCLVVETWPAVADGLHNSNTDLTTWKGQFYLAHAASPWHLASRNCRIVLRRSDDARSWNEVAAFSLPGQDIRDPKLAVIAGRLHLYVLKNKELNPEPFATAMATSSDGVTWSPLEDLEPNGWLLWRPKSRDGHTWYAPAYWWEHGRSILLKSSDGRNWDKVSQIHDGDRNDETDIEFLPDGRMIATARLEATESIFGDREGCTLIALSAPPYTHWTHVKSRVARLDGPCLFAWKESVYAVGRYDPQASIWMYPMGSVFAKKRTALYHVRPDGLVRLSDLPSCGDTSYAGVVMRGNQAYVSYYTNDPRADYPWILGMLLRSEVRMARIDLTPLARHRTTSEESSQDRSHRPTRPTSDKTRRN